MNKLIIYYFFFLATVVSSKDDTSDCYEFMHYEQNSYFTDTTHLRNGSMLYYQWNCDSTWLTLETDKRIVLKSCSELDPIMCSRLGLHFIEEYPDYLLFYFDWISGCCTPPDLVYIDKLTGQEIERIDYDLFVWGDSEKDYSLYFKDTTYTDLIYVDHLKAKRFKYSFEKDKVLESARKHSVLHIERLFDNYHRTADRLTLEFLNNTDEIDTIEIKLK